MLGLLNARIEPAAGPAQQSERQQAISGEMRALSGHHKAGIGQTYRLIRADEWHFPSGIRNRPSDFTYCFVDALASLLMVFVFVLMVFVLIQANLAYRLSGQDASLSALRQELAQLGELLSLNARQQALSADLARIANWPLQKSK